MTDEPDDLYVLFLTGPSVILRPNQRKIVSAFKET